MALSYKNRITSQLAASAIELSGKAGIEREKILAAIRENPGLTSMEISELTGVERHNVASRSTELRDRGLIRNGAKRECRVRGVLMMTWWPVETLATRPTIARQAACMSGNAVGGAQEQVGLGI